MRLDTAKTLGYFFGTYTSIFYGFKLRLFWVPAFFYPTL